MGKSSMIVFIFILNIFATYTLFAQDNGMVRNTSIHFLQGNAYGGQIATEAPTIDFGLVRLTQYGEEFGHWGNVVLGPDGRFYFALGNHQNGEGRGRSLFVCYDPQTQSDEILMYSMDVLGHREGKWHGRPDIHPQNGDIYIMGFYQGDLIRYNIYSKEITVIGKPLEVSYTITFPEHIWDWERERFYSTTAGYEGKESIGNFLVYDTENKSVVFFGMPVDSETGDNLKWDKRARCLDRETGCIYCTDPDTKYIIQYNPTTNSFKRMQSKLKSSLRAWTNEKNDENEFWIFDDEGNVYTFNPEEDIVVYKGKNWGSGYYVCFIETSPGGRYLYYSIAKSHAGEKYGLPIIQYDTRTNQKKAIAFLYNYYKNKYNYESDKIYGGALSKNGR